MALNKVVAKTKIGDYMKSMYDWCYIAMTCVLVSFSSIVHANVEDIIDETRETDPNDFFIQSINPTFIGRVDFPVDLYKIVKSVELRKMDTPTGIRIFVHENSSRRQLSGDLMYDKGEGADFDPYTGYVSYRVKKISWSPKMVDVSELICCYPVEINATAGGSTLSIIMRSTPLGYFDINYKEIISNLMFMIGGPFKDDLVLSFSGTGKVLSNKVIIRVSSEKVASILSMAQSR